jgi:hypothetical protein
LQGAPGQFNSYSPLGDVAAFRRDSGGDGYGPPGSPSYQPSATQQDQMQGESQNQSTNSSDSAANAGTKDQLEKKDSTSNGLS